MHLKVKAFQIQRRQSLNYVPNQARWTIQPVTFVAEQNQSPVEANNSLIEITEQNQLPVEAKNLKPSYGASYILYCVDSSCYLLTKFGSNKIDKPEFS